MPRSCAARTTDDPGSATAGMPASLSRPMSWPSSAAQQRRASNRRRVVALLVHLARQFLDLLLPAGLRQRLHLADALEVGARGLGVLADPVREARGGGDRAGGSTSRQRGLLSQPKSSGVGTR
jgi:hypothetical protein